MARLEIDIAGNNSDLKKVLTDSKSALSQFSKEVERSSFTKALNAEKLATQQARTEAIKYASTLRSSLAESLNNAKTRTEEYKQATSDAKTIVEENKQAITDSIVALNKQKEATEASRTATQQARQASAEMVLANKQNKQSVDASADSLVGMRKKLSDLTKIYDNMNAKVRDSGSVQRNLVTEIQKTIGAISAAEQETGRYQRQVGNYAKGLGNANGVALEFNRIIQDAPFGMMGIGNNIQQLTANWQAYVVASKRAAAAQGITLTQTMLLKGALASVISPANLLTLGIAAVTSAWTVYTMWSQRSAKATKGVKEETKSYIETLNGLAQAQAEGQTKAVDDLTNLRLMYQATQNLSISLGKRREIAKQLIDQYPKQLKGLTDEAILAGKASTAYDSLTKSITATAMAAAYASKITENSKKQVENYLKTQDLNKTYKSLTNIIDLNKELSKGGVQGGGALGTGVNPLNVMYENILESRNKVEKELSDIKKNDADLTKQNIDLQGKYNKQIIAGADATGTLTTSLEKAQKQAKQLKDYSQDIKDVAQKSQFSVDITESDEGLDTLLERNKQKYKGYLDDLNKLEVQNRTGKNVDNRAESAKAISATRLQIITNEALEEKAIRVKYAQETADLIEKITSDAGVERIAGRQRDLDKSRNYFDELANKYRHDATVQLAILESRKQAEASINEKYDAKAYESANKLFSKIAELETKKIPKGLGGDTLKKELDTRLKQIEDFYTQIAEILKTAGVKDASGLSVKQMMSFDTASSNVKQASEDEANKKLEGRISKVVESGMRQGIDSILGDITNLGSTFSEVFSNVFNKLASSMQSIFNNVIATKLGDKLKSSFDDINIAGLGNKLSQALVAGVGIAGNLVGGMTKKTSALGQTAGGLLSGAATGAAFGPIGAGIGALVGGLSGFFSAKRAQKQERLQEQQLAEQKKQTALQERANALAYTSSIVGQRTNQGIVQGVDRNAFGDIVFKIAGRDLVASVKNEENAQKRGL